jgi:hypothetical protein
MAKEIVRVLRVIEYVGEREWVERQVAESIHGVKYISGSWGKGEIRAATVGVYPEILANLGAVEDNDG